LAAFTLDSELDDATTSHQASHHNDDGEDEKQMNESAADVESEESQGPQDNENNSDGIEHGFLESKLRDRKAMVVPHFDGCSAAVAVSTPDPVVFAAS
jgi:hypothetical protein